MLRIPCVHLFLMVIFVSACTPVHGQRSPVDVAEVDFLPTVTTTKLQPISRTVEMSDSIAANVSISTSVTGSIPGAVVDATPRVTIQAHDLTPDEQLQAIERYRKNYCGYCHTLAVADTHGIFGPTHDQVGTLAAMRLQDARYHGTATTATEYLLESLIDPQVYMVDGYQLTNHHMPAFTHLSPEDLTLLVQFLLQQQ